MTELKYPTGAFKTATEVPAETAEVVDLTGAPYEARKNIEPAQPPAQESTIGSHRRKLPQQDNQRHPVRQQFRFFYHG